jgi:hypothetical protein
MNNKFSNDASNNKIIHTTHKSNVHPNYKYFQKFLFFGLIIFSTYLILNRPAHLPLPQAFLAISIIWCGIIPGFIYLNDVNRPPFPFIPVIGFIYSIWFCLSSFKDFGRAISVITKSFDFDSNWNDNFFYFLLFIKNFTLEKFYAHKTSNPFPPK